MGNCIITRLSSVSEDILKLNEFAIKTISPTTSILLYVNAYTTARIIGTGTFVATGTKEQSSSSSINIATTNVGDIVIVSNKHNIKRFYDWAAYTQFNLAQLKYDSSLTGISFYGDFDLKNINKNLSSIYLYEDKDNGDIYGTIFGDLSELAGMSIDTIQVRSKHITGSVGVLESIETCKSVDFQKCPYLEPNIDIANIVKGSKCLLKLNSNITFSWTHRIDTYIPNLYVRVDDIDSVLVDLAPLTSYGTASSKTPLYIFGDASTKTSASDSAVSTLKGKNCDVIINGAPL